MSDHDNLRALADSLYYMVTVERTDLVELLAEVDKLRAAAPKRPKKAAPTASAAPLPAWLPLDAWNAFLDMRKKIKKPATEYAQKLLLKKLAAFHANDMDPGVILNQSIVAGWMDLYEPKDQQGNARGYDSTSGRPVYAAGRKQAAPESDADRAARRTRWGIQDLDQGGTDA